jgi:hypothetical protein
MRDQTAAFWLIVFLAVVAKPSEAGLPPGAPYLLTITGDNTITFVPQAQLNPNKIDYEAKVEYLIDIRTAADEAAAKKEGAGTKKKTARKARKKDNESNGAAVTTSATSAVDVSLHSTQMRFRQNGQVTVESRLSRLSFQGRLLPEAPILRVTSNDAPPRLQEILRTFDTPIATILLDDEMNAVARKVRENGPFHAMAETLLSIHTPVPRSVAAWDAPTQLAMGHNQTAKGTLHFEKIKESLDKTGGLVNVKVSGVLKAEGVVVGKLIKDGTYTVTGAQAYEPKSRAWKSARWSVVVDNELANPGGVTIAHAKGTMTVTAKALDGSTADPAAPLVKP